MPYAAPAKEDPLANMYREGQEKWQTRQAIERALSEGQRHVFRDCPECPEMVLLPTGTFEMGSNDGEADERPVHRVTIARPFAIGKYEVTQGEWVALMGDHPSDFGGERNPVDRVDWNDAKEFVRRLSTRTGEEYRLPSEAEWEYAARAGSSTKYPWGILDPVCRAGASNGAKFDGSAECHRVRGTGAIGTFAPNAFDLFDVIGNVWEWTEDCYHGSYIDAPTDGGAQTSGDCARRVLRGGSWYNNRRDLRSANRDRSTPANRNNSFGIRVARTI